MPGPFVELKHKLSIGAVVSLVSATTACGEASTPRPAEEEEVGACDENVVLAAELALEQNCHQCHGQNGTANGSVNFMLDAEQLIAHGLVIPGDPDASRIYIRMAGDTMPPAGVSPRPDAAARESVRTWIECGAPPFAEADSSREFISTEEVLSALRKDLELQDAGDRKFIRYLSLVNLHNDPNVSDDSLSTYRHGLNKQVNDVSWGSAVLPLDSIDDRDILYRVDIRRYVWQAEGNKEDLWELMASQYPYGVHYPDQMDAAYLYAETTSLVPVINADFFVFATSEPPLYYEMLRLPPNIAAWKAFLGVQTGEVWTAGVVNSGVSTSNRVVRRFMSQFGPFWESADFATSTDNKDILHHPLAPTSDSKLSDFAYVPDGGEYIFSLPNKLHGYAITDKDGNLIDQAPAEIVFDRNDPFNPHVRSGRKCAKCHVEGINPAVDQVLDYVTSSPDLFPKKVIDEVIIEYPPVAEFEQLVAQDQALFLEARADTGIPTNVEGKDSVPISFLADSFQASMNIDRAAADFGLPVESLRAMIESSPDLRNKGLGPLLLDGGVIKRESFRAAFPEAVCALGLGHPMINGEIVVCQVCGDGEVTGTEACDDGNDQIDDGCLPNCVIPTSCLDVLEFDNTSPDGPEALDVDNTPPDGPYMIAPAGYEGDPFPAWCDMTTDGGGWTLAMRHAPEAGQFHFFSPHWTSESVVNDSVLHPTDPSDGKFRAFDFVAGAEIRGCLKDPNTQGYGCKSYPLPTVSTLLGLFTTVPVGSDVTAKGLYFTEADEQKLQWLTIQGLTPAHSSVPLPLYIHVGINIDDDQSCYDGRVRFGLVLNEEASANALNDAAGFGAQAHYTPDCDLEGLDSAWATASGFAVSGPNIYNTAGQIWIR